MKNFIKVVLGLFLALSFSCSFAQTKVPAKVSEAFSAKFPDAKDVKWGKESTHEYEAEWKQNEMGISANFSETGEWLETETDIAESELPEAVLTAFHAKYGAETPIKEAAKIEKKGGKIGYEVEFKKGAKTAEVYFNADGTLAK